MAVHQLNMIKNQLKEASDVVIARKLVALIKKNKMVLKDTISESLNIPNDQLEIFLSIMNQLQILHFQNVDNKEQVIWDGFESLKMRAQKPKQKSERMSNLPEDMIDSKHVVSESALDYSSLNILATQVLESMVKNINRSIDFKKMLVEIWGGRLVTKEDENNLMLVGNIMAGCDILWAWDGTLFSWNEKFENEKIALFFSSGDEPSEPEFEDARKNSMVIESIDCSTTTQIKTSNVTKKNCERSRAASNKNSKRLKSKKRGKTKPPANKNPKSNGTARKKRSRDEALTVEPPLKVQVQNNNKIKITRSMNNNNNNSNNNNVNYNTKMVSPSSSTNSSTFKRKHRVSCHRCGNMRKSFLLCNKCPQIYCKACVKLMENDHGKDVFNDGW